MGKFIVVNTVGLFILIALAIGGYLDGIIHSTVLPAVIGLVSLVATGLGLIALKRVKDANWICKRMTGFGLAGTVLGVINAFTHASFVGDPTVVMASLSSGIGLALYSTFVGLIGWLWLDWNLVHQGIHND